MYGPALTPHVAFVCVVCLMAEDAWGEDNALLQTIIAVTGVRGDMKEVAANGAWAVVFCGVVVSMLTAWPCILARNVPPLVTWTWR